MLPLSAQSVVDSALIRMNLVPAGVGEFITPAIALDFVQGSLEGLTGLLTRLCGDTYFLQVADVLTQAYDDTISTPRLFATLESIDWINGEVAVAGTEKYRMLPAQFDNYDPTPAKWGHDKLPSYRLEANTIVFTPVPTAVETLRIKYTTGLFIQSLTDFIPAQVGWKEWLICDFACRVRDRQEKDATSWMDKKMLAEAQIEEWASRRDRNGAMQVRDPRDALNRDARASARGWLWR